MMGPFPVKKLLVVVELPWLVVTVIGPVTAPAGTVAVISVVETTLTLLEDTEPNLTFVPLKKLPPKMVTAAPLAAAAGEKELIEGNALARKLVALTLVPALVMTVMGPLPAPAGTVASTSVGPM
jgi:hypothetical protein